MRSQPPRSKWHQASQERIDSEARQVASNLISPKMRSHTSLKSLYVMKDLTSRMQEVQNVLLEFFGVPELLGTYARGTATVKVLRTRN